MIYPCIKVHVEIKMAN